MVVFTDSYFVLGVAYMYNKKDEEVLYMGMIVARRDNMACFMDHKIGHRQIFQ